MTTAKDIMTRTVLSVEPETPIHDAMEILLENSITSIPVIDADGRLVGILSEADRLKMLETPPNDERPSVANYMTPGVITVGSNTLLEQIANLITTFGIGQIPVMEGSDVIGVISRRDLIRALQNAV